MKQRFNLSLWLQDKSRKVVTRDGREVEIIKYDMKGTHFPVLYVISNQDGSQCSCECSKSGMCQFDNTRSSTDLFFADEEVELTKFEKMLRYVLECYSGYEFASESEIETLKLNAKTLLDLAREENKNICGERKQDTLQDFMEKACEWLKENMGYYHRLWQGGWNSDSYDENEADSLIKDFKQAMEE